jgi:Tetratricopeptide repeat
MSDSGITTDLVNELRALGDVYLHQGDLIRSEQHYRLALTLYENSFPDRHEDAMLCVLGLVELLQRKNKNAEAQQLEKTIPAMNARRRAVS